MNDLPNVYQNHIDHNINNEQNYFVSFDKNKKINKSITIDDIDNLLNDRHHIFKPNVKITTNNDVINCKIVRRINNELLTMDNKKIDINLIRNIEII